MMEIIYSERESKTLELKSTVVKLDGIIKTPIAFANGVGGKIIIGVEDKTRQDKTRQDKTRQDKTRQDKTRQDRQDKTRQDKKGYRRNRILARSYL
jgi:predicted HTH transcriptional regulator